MLTRPRRGALVAVLLLLAALPLLLAATHGSGRLTVLGCGASITSSTTLAADIGPCSSGFGVVISADHITLNLNGHQIEGATTSGFAVFSGNTGVTVENGGVTGFFDGVHLGGDANRVMNMSVDHEPNAGIAATGQNDVISGNRVSDSGADGISATGQKDVVSGNRVSTSHADGISATGPNDMVTGNRAFAGSADGISGGGVGSQYTNNILQGNSGSGLGVFNAASISGNKALSNGGDGIAFNAGQAVVVTNNIANGNQHNGFQQNPSADPTLATLSGNKAYFNGLNGIVTRPGVTDGGNNKADSNGDSTECTDIVCS